MKIVLFISILFSASHYYGQTKHDSINNFDSEGKKYGKWITYDNFEGESIKSVEHYKNGVLEGEAISYWKNGIIMCRNTYINGLRQGKSKYYYKNGAIQDIYLFSNDSCLFHVMFTPSGKIFQEDEGDKFIQYFDGKPNR